MRIARFAATTLLLSAWIAPVSAAEAPATAKPAAGAPTVQKVEAGTVQSGLATLWARLKSLSPGFSGAASGQQSDRAEAQVAGVRGTEATQTSLQPYWKDDDEADPAFKAELEEFRAAQQLADGAKYSQAATAFDGFLLKHPASRLRANAQFGAALATLSAGQADKGRTAMQRFVTENPDHPLKDDAAQLLRE
jgi:TolA-binding protein